jgi:hypothetical protein
MTHAQKKEARTVAPAPSPKPENSKPEARKLEALQNLERFTDQLAVMAHWFEQLKTEANDVDVYLDPERFDSMKRRVSLFCEAADDLCDMLGGRR